MCEQLVHGYCVGNTATGNSTDDFVGTVMMSWPTSDEECSQDVKLQDIDET